MEQINVTKHGFSNVVAFSLNIACEQAHLRVKHTSSEGQSDPTGWSLVKRHQKSEPALISVIFSFLLRLSEVKYHWLRSGKGEKTANLLCLMRSDYIPTELVIYRTFSTLKISCSHVESEEVLGAALTF